MTVTETHVQGRVERVHSGVVEGWAWRHGAATERVEVRVLVDGIEVATGVAELARESLASAGIGDGRHGFRLALFTDGAVVEPGRHVLRVEAGGTTLPAAARFTVSAEDEESYWRGVQFVVDGGSVVPEVEGRVELVRDGVVEGWAWSPRDVDRRVRVRVLLEEEELGTTVADLPRPSLQRAGLGDGAHAFRFSLPPERARPGRRLLTVKADGVVLAAASNFRTETGRTDNPWYGAQFWLAGDGADPLGASYSSIDQAPGRHEPDEPGPAVLGPDGWLFDAAVLIPETDEQATETETRVAELLKDLDHLRLRLSELGVKLLPVLIPAKEHVYIDRLPPGAARNLRASPGDLIVQGLMKHPALDPLDLLPALRIGAKERPVYAPLRPQLSDWGIYCAYRGVIKRIGTILPDVPPPADLQESNVVMGPATRWHGHAAVLTEAGLVPATAEGRPDPPEEPIVIAPEGAAAVTPREDLARLEAGSAVGWEQPDRRDLPRAVLVGPDEHAGIAEWCARHFRFTVMLGRDAPLIDLVSLERPDVVVYFIDERSLIRGPGPTTATAPPAERDGRPVERALLHRGDRPSLAP